MLFDIALVAPRLVWGVSSTAAGQVGLVRQPGGRTSISFSRIPMASGAWRAERCRGAEEDSFFEKSDRAKAWRLDGYG